MTRDNPMLRNPALAIALCLIGCGHGDDRGPGSGSGDAVYAVSSIVFGTNETTSYVSLISSLDAAAYDATQPREFAGLADLWVQDGAVFVAEDEPRTITRFTVEDGVLVAAGVVSFASYGLTDFGFWRNIFLSPTKAYFINGASEYIVWNPQAMAITKTVALPALPARNGLTAFPGYMDRAAIVRGGRLYHPLYFTDSSYFKYAQGSVIVVFDVERDQLVTTIDVPCPGVDHVTRDGADNLYFSSWVYAAGAAAVLQQPGTCVARLAADGSAPAVVMQVAAATAGHQGGALRYLGSGKAMMSVLYPEHAKSSDVSDVTFGGNWRFWSYDLATGNAAQIDGFDWNAGGVYGASIADQQLMLVPAGDFSSTTVYELTAGAAPRAAFETSGWSLRLFQVR
jgi:hypothetical protein